MIDVGILDSNLGASGPVTNHTHLSGFARMYGGNPVTSHTNARMQWFTAGRLDCMAPDRERGLRCAATEEESEDYADHAQCVAMECASTGGAPQVLVNGSPCDPRALPLWPLSRDLAST